MRRIQSTGSDQKPKRVLIIGNPNIGKTTLFNNLTGARAKVSNYPGVTVERRSAQIESGDSKAEMVDVPGMYSLTACSPEEKIAVNELLGTSVEQPDLVVVVVSATALSRSLYLAIQVLEFGLPVILAVNMIDELESKGLSLHADRLAALLGAPVVQTVASKGIGVLELKEKILALDVERAEAREFEPIEYSNDVQHCVDQILSCDPVLSNESLDAKASDSIRRAWALWAYLSSATEDVLSSEVKDKISEIEIGRSKDAASLDQQIIEARYQYVDQIVSHVISKERDEKQTWSERVDRILTRPLLGLGVFLFVMFVLFQSLFSWSEPLVSMVEEGISFLQGSVDALLSAGPFRDLLKDGVLAGVGNVLVFVPQIALLFLFLGFLEDTGYLARVAFVMDKIMKSVGLHGKAFIPLLSGFGCAVPAVLSTRTIERKRDRLLTMMVLPLMSCSARLPIYVLVTAVVFPTSLLIGGIFPIGAVVLFAMYFLSLVFALGAAFVLGRTTLQGKPAPFVLELPPYRMPTWRNLTYSTWEKVRAFLTDAGTMILAITIVLWALLSYPKLNDAEIVQLQVDPQFGTSAQVDAVQDVQQGIQEEEMVEQQLAMKQVERSFAGRMGKALEPVFEPLGFDWRINVGVISAFAAREVFVSSLAIVFGLGEADEENTSLRKTLRDAKTSEGRKLFSPLVGVTLMVFFVLACQCMSTLAVVKQETKSFKWPVFMFVYMSALAYVVSFGVYQIGGWLGFG